MPSASVSAPSAGPLLRVPDVAALLDVHPRSVYRWLDAGVFPEALLIRIGRSVYFRKPALEAWIAGARESDARR